jgi:signal transduction histidine kinase
MYRRRRWLAVFAALALVGIVELLSDSLFDGALPFPSDTIVVVAVMSAVAGCGAWLAFARIDRLDRDLVDRNTALESRNAALRAVYDVSLAVAGREDPEQTITSIVDHAHSLLNVDAALVALDGPGGILTLRAASASPGVLRPSDTADPPDYDELDCFLQDGYIVAALAPVGHGDKRVGTLCLATSRPRTFQPSELETLSALATQVGLALEAARIHDELRDLAVQDERERIAREMHDGLAQVLAYVNTKSQAVGELLADGRVADATRQLDQLATAARSLYVDVREAILTLSTPAAAERGAAAVLEEYAAQYAESSKLAVRFTATPDAVQAPLSNAAQSEVFSIAREALTNVRKHARAQRVSLDLRVDGHELVLLIKDDGAGFEADLLAVGPERWPHFGLAGMRERAESIGGTIGWRSESGKGTEVELRVPVGGPIWTHPFGDVTPSDTGRSGSQHQAVRSPAAAGSEAD